MKKYEQSGDSKIAGLSPQTRIKTKKNLQVCASVNPHNQIPLNAGSVKAAAMIS